MSEITIHYNAAYSNRHCDSAVADAEEACDHVPTAAERAQLSSPIAHFLGLCTCYDMLGTSTQVVVLDVNAPLAIAFVAAQETRVQSGVLWDPTAQSFVGVMSSTDYVKILLYCYLHPSEAEEVSNWTIRKWRAMRDDWAAFLPPDLLKQHQERQKSGSHRSALKKPPPGVVTCKTENSLHQCLQKMRDFHVRRIVTMAEKEAESFSVVAIMDVEHIVEYLGVMFFHLRERHYPGSGLQNDDDEATVNGLFALNSGTLPPNVSSILRDVEQTTDASFADSPASGAASTNADSASATGLSFAGGGGAQSPLERFVPVGPYKTFFDVPFRNVPTLGAQRSTPLFVTPSDLLRDALIRMLEYDIETIAVVASASDLRVLNIISRSDLLRMEDQGVYNISVTVAEALGSKTSDEVYVFYETDTLSNIFSHFVRRRVKELFMVDRHTGVLKGQLNIAEFVFFLVFGDDKSESKK